MRQVFRTVCLATGDSADAPWLFRVDADTVPFRSEDATPGSRACVRELAPLGRIGRAGHQGAFWCASPFPAAGLGVLFVCSAPSGLRLPCFWLFLRFLFFSFFLFFSAPPLSLAFRVFRPSTEGPYQDRPLLCPFHHNLSLRGSCSSPGSAFSHKRIEKNSFTQTLAIPSTIQIQIHTAGLRSAHRLSHGGRHVQELHQKGSPEIGI